MSIVDRYASAVRSSNLRSKPETHASDSDVLGAVGLASKHQPLAWALHRLFVGDNHAMQLVLDHMTRKIVGKAYRLGREIDEVGATIMARLVLDWVRSTTCPACGGLGFERMVEAPALSDQACINCRGTSRRPFDSLFSMERLDLARWICAEVEREAAKAGPSAMAALAPRLDL